MKVEPIFSEQDEDLSDNRWYASGTRYAKMSVNDPRFPSGQKKRYAHREVARRIIGRDLIRGEVVDHINGDELDNRRENIRVTNWAGNSQNRRTRNGGTTFNKAAGKWQAAVGYNGKRHYLGLFETQSEAIIVAQRKRKEFGFLR